MNYILRATFPVKIQSERKRRRKKGKEEKKKGERKKKSFSAMTVKLHREVKFVGVGLTSSTKEFR